MFRYTVRYLRLGSVTRVYRITVTARNAEDARRAAAIRDPQFGSTTQTPRRMGVVEPERCRICKGELDEDWTRIIEGGFVCWRCREKADLPEDQYVTVDGGRFGDIEVEWT